ncbi:MAG: hypothetical protein ACREE1_04605 [Stellaceae bacterium]
MEPGPPLRHNPRSTVSIAGHPVHPMLIPFPIAFARIVGRILSINIAGFLPFLAGSLLIAAARPRAGSLGAAARPFARQ